MDFRIAVKSFIVKDGRLLILKRASDEVQMPNIWEIPGGRLEPGENPFEGVKRETKEETGIDIEVVHPLSVRHFKRDDGQTITMLIFLCKALNEEIKISKEHSDFEWINIEKSKKLSKFYEKEIEKYNQLKNLL